MKEKTTNSLYRDESKWCSLTRVKTILLLIGLYLFPFSIYSQSAKTTSGTSVNTVEVTKKIKTKGKVTDLNDLALPGVTVKVQGKAVGTTTDSNGYFELIVPDDAKTLIFSYVGMKTQEVEIQNKSLYNIVLEDNSVNVSEVVVVGYGKQAKISVIGAISSVDTKEMIKSPVSSVQNSLAGRATGLTIVQKSGAPGNDFADIYIRGKATYGNSSPLILVDGIERDITTIDPNEIESINILKDASATAVFGVRGANGVIVVTTKVGSTSGKPQISFTANYGVSNPTHVPRFLNSAEYARMSNAGALNDVRTSLLPNGPSTYVNEFSDADIALYESGVDPIFHPNTDWTKLLIGKNAPQQSYNVNISGGTSKVKYFVSLGYFNQVGNFGGLQNFKDMPVNGVVNRYNIRSNTDFQWTKDFSTSIKFSSQISDGRNDDWVAGSENVLHAIWAAIPIQSVPVIDGKLIRSTPEIARFSTAESPMWLYNSSYNVHYQSRTTLDLSAEYKLDAIMKGLSLRGKFAYDNLYLQNAVITRANDAYEIRRTAPGYTGNYYELVHTEFQNFFSSTQSYSSNYRLYSEASVNYIHTFDKKHTVTALVLGTMERIYKGGTPALPYNYLGLVGRATYDFKKKYLVELNIGYNGSENFAVGKQFGLFPAYSLGYIVSEEDFFPKNAFVTFMKIRGSEGKVGNDKVGTGRFLYTPSSYNLVASGDMDMRFGETNIFPTGGLYQEAKIGNPNVSWEVATKSNIGVELKMFDNKLSISGDLFKEQREGILGRYNNVPFTFGDVTILPSYNLGVVENGGYEFEIGYRSKGGKNIEYWINGNYSFARNKIVYNDEVTPAFPNLVRTGLPINQPFMLVSDGFYNTWDEVNDNKRIPTKWDLNVQPGDLKFKDINGDGIINENDITAVGYTNIPEIVYGVNAGIKIYSFDFSFLLQGATHVSNYYSTPIFLSSKYSARTEADYDAWTAEKYANGDKILYPRLNNGIKAANAQVNSYLNLDASYLRIKNVEMGYTLNSKFSRKFGCSLLRFNISGQNLATFSQMKYWDPESVGSTDRQYPITYVINVGLKANF